MNSYFVGIDVGGTKIAGGLVDATTPDAVAYSTKLATPARNVTNSIAAVISDLLEEAAGRGGGVEGVGIGAPGVIDPEAGTVISAGPTMPGWAGTAIKSAIAAQFGLPVAVHNDVRIMGLGEATYGAGREFSRVLFVSLGTGVGGAFVEKGQLVASPHFTAGEIRGLIGRSPSGQALPVEQFASGPAIARWYFEQTGANVQLPEIMVRYRDGEEAALELIERCMTGLGEALAGLISAIDVDAVIIGGGVGSIGDPIVNPLRAGIRDSVLPTLADIPIIPARLGTNAPIVGAAYLIKSTLQGEK